MKKIASKILLFLIFVVSNHLSKAQTSKVWVTIADESHVPFRDDRGMLRSNDSVFNHYLNALQIISIDKPFSASRTRELQRVYELECNCLLPELYSTLKNQVDAVSGVEFAPKYDTLHTPNDYQLSLGVNNYALNLINAQTAWDITKGDTNVIISITDQNYYMTHSELVGKIVHPFNNNSTQTHGTAVAILAAGNTNNNNGLASIGYNCRLGLYGMNFNQMLIAAYDGARVINMSWSAGCFFNTYQQMAIDEAYNLGAFLIAAAGNGNTCGNPSSFVYPASLQHVFAVTSIGPNDNHMRFPNDTTSTHQHNNMVDLAAPGYDVAINPAEGWYLNSSGTSYAAPYVSGTVGLMLSINPCLSRLDIDTILRLSAVNIDSLNPLYIGKLGAGRLNAEAAVQLATNWASQPMTVTSQPANAFTTPGGNAQFTASSTSSFPVYQWQYDSSGVFVNLVNNGTYSGVNTSTLIITAAGNNLNNVNYRCVMSSGYCQAISNAASLQISNNIILPDSAGTIFYPTPICLGDTISINIDSVNNATGYNWTITGNSQIVSGQNTTSIDIVVYDTSFTITVTPVNSFGSGVSSSTYIQTGAIATASFAGGATICQGDTALLTLNLTGNSPWSGLLNGLIPFSTTTSPITIPVSPSVTTDYILTELNAGYCPGFPDYYSTMATVLVRPYLYDTVQQIICSSQLPFVWNGQNINTSGSYNDTIPNTIGCENITTLQLTVIVGNVPLAPASITQTLVSNQCNSRIYRYTAAITANATGYKWTIPTSCGGQGTVTVDSGNINSSRIIKLKYTSNAASFLTDSIKVRAFNSCGLGPNRAARLINLVLNPPAAPISITVTPVVTNLCGERRYRYRAPNLPIATASNAAATGYLWSFTQPMPLQGVIDSGTLQSQVIVVKYVSNQASLPTDSIFVQYTSDCGNSAKRKLRITIAALNGPAAPSSITITTLNGSTCGERRYRLSMPVYPTVSGSLSQPNGYQWTLVGNASTYGVIDSGTVNSRVIVLKYTNDQATTIGDSIKAQYLSQCGAGSFRATKFSAQKLSPPLAPSAITITAVQTNVCGARIYRYSGPNLPLGTLLNATATGYLWSFTGALGSNATIDSGTVNGKTIRVKYSSNSSASIGDSVRLRFTSYCGNSNNKSSKLTNTVLIGCPPVTGKMLEKKAASIAAKIYPNPSDGIFYIETKGMNGNMEITITDVTGRIRYARNTMNNGVLQIKERLEKGVYFVVIKQNGVRLMEKIVVQ